MPCEHTGPPELIEIAEAHLREKDIPLSEWDGLKFAWGENVDTMWKSVWLEVERRDGDWVVTKIDRSEETLPEEREGFHELGRGR